MGYRTQRERSEEMISGDLRGIILEVIHQIPRRELYDPENVQVH